MIVGGDLNKDFLYPTKGWIIGGSENRVPHTLSQGIDLRGRTKVGYGIHSQGVDHRGKSSVGYLTPLNGIDHRGYSVGRYLIVRRD